MKEKKDPDIKVLIDHVHQLAHDIREYIISTPHWPLYWMTNKEITDFIREYPEEWEDMMDIEVISVGPGAPQFSIKFQNHPDDIESIMRYGNLTSFRDSVKARWAEYSGRIEAFRIAELNKEIEYYEKKAAEAKEELKKYEGYEG